MAETECKDAGERTGDYTDDVEDRVPLLDLIYSIVNLCNCSRYDLNMVLTSAVPCRQEVYCSREESSFQET